MIVIKYKKLIQEDCPELHDLVLSDGNVGVDLHSAEECLVGPQSSITIGTGICLNMPETVVTGYADHDMIRFQQTLMAKIEGRSGLASKFSVFPIGGIIDPSYRGEIKVVLMNGSHISYHVRAGDRIAQLVFYTCLASEQIQLIEDDGGWEETKRGEKGFGSSGI